MLKEKKWQILSERASIKDKGLRVDKIIKILLQNRGIKTKKEVENFLHAKLSSVTTKSVGIDTRQVSKTIQRIKKAIEKKEHIVVFGDYDVDGIAGTAILWETLFALGANVTPYIPNRIDEGYGLSIAGIKNVQSQIPNIKLIITVDNGIVANEAINFANKNNIDVIITDHHTVSSKIPHAHAIVHTTQICGAGVAYLLSQEISKKSKIQNTTYEIPKDHLSLVALATVADLVPLTGANRVLLTFGLAELRNTRRPGLIALFQEAKIEQEQIGVYEIGHIIAPRLNAMGRLASAMDSLRLLCTKDRLRAKVLADSLGRTNKERQLLTSSAVEHAIKIARNNQQETTKKKLLFIAHDTYEEGVIGLVAGKLVEEFYLPAIVIAKGEVTSKASARSIVGFNIIEFIRTHAQFLINAGGHPMAAGFTIETKNIIFLQKALEVLAEKQIDKEMLKRVLKIDMRIPLEIISTKLYEALQNVGPFGMGNPEPTFVSTCLVEEIKTVGAEKKHLKLRVAQQPLATFEAIAFGMGDMVHSLKPGSIVDIVYTISENVWNGKTSLQLKIKDIKSTKDTYL